jgi:predicted  nucleic acid-binding Zn-ribbon protein
MLQSYRPTPSISGHRFYGGALREHVKLAAVYDRKRVEAWRDEIDEIIESAKDQCVEEEVLEARERVEDAEEALKKAKEDLQETKAQLTDARAWAGELEDESRQAMAKWLKLV